MLITFSGMVGSGKSTCAKHVMNLLESADIDCRYLRFRSLGLLGFRGRRPRRGDDQPAAAHGGARWSGFQPRTLTAFTACGYLARIVAFRLFGHPGPRACHVLDRFFYDSFVHYRLNTRLERWYMTAIRHVMPVPDVAVLLLAT